MLSPISENNFKFIAMFKVLKSFTSQSGRCFNEGESIEKANLESSGLTAEEISDNFEEESQDDTSEGDGNSVKYQATTTVSIDETTTIEVGGTITEEIYETLSDDQKQSFVKV